MLKTLDAFEWPDGPMQVKYFSGVSAVSGFWRSTGMLSKLRDVAVDLFDDEVATNNFSTVPSRCLRGRWGSMDDVEAFLMGRLPLVHAVLRRWMDVNKKKVTIAAVGGDEDAAYQAHARAMRSNACAMSGDRRFQFMVAASLIAKNPLVGYFNWAQKRIRETNKYQDDAVANG
eukprot:2079529-Pyramimonas_sp.AAC.1